MQQNPLSAISLIRKLKLNQRMIFERVVETRSVVRAANWTRLTQLAVTKVIHEFESCFGGALFARSNRGVVPTELGLLLDTLRIALMPRVAAQQFEDAGLLRILDLPESGAFGTVGFRCVRIESRARPVRHLSRVYGRRSR